MADPATWAAIATAAAEAGTAATATTAAAGTAAAAGTGAAIGAGTAAAAGAGAAAAGTAATLTAAEAAAIGMTAADAAAAGITITEGATAGTTAAAGSGATAGASQAGAYGSAASEVPWWETANQGGNAAQGSIQPFSYDGGASAQAGQSGQVVEPSQWAQQYPDMGSSQSATQQSGDYSKFYQQQPIDTTSTGSQYASQYPDMAPNYGTQGYGATPNAGGSDIDWTKYGKAAAALASASSPQGGGGGGRAQVIDSGQGGYAQPQQMTLDEIRRRNLARALARNPGLLQRVQAMNAIQSRGFV